MLGRKKVALLIVALFSICSCVDDMYDLSKKELSLDMKIEDNRIALPLGSLRPILLDSILDLSSIPVLEIDSVSRTYSLSFYDNVVTRVAQKDLSVLQEMSKLSSNIDPIRIELERIKFAMAPFDTVVSMPLEDVELTDVTLEPINEEVVLNLEEIKIDPIKISGEELPVEFEIPVVDLQDVTVPGTSQMVSFAVEDIKVEGVESKSVQNVFDMGVNSIDLENISAPAFASNMSKIVGEDDPTLQTALGQGDNFQLPLPVPLSFNNTSITSDGEMTVDFNYLLPKEIKHFDKVTMQGRDDKGALFEFKVVNPSLLDGLTRTINFSAKFPENYELALYEDDNKKYYSLSADNVISVVDMPTNGETATIHFYLKEIKNLNDSKYYVEDDNGKSLLFNDVVTYTVDYAVSGSVIIPRGTTVEEIKEGLSYSIILDASFNVEEAYGTTNPVEFDFGNENLDFSFELENLKYIKKINTIELNPAVSQLHFITSIDNGFGGFDIDSKSKIMLSFPEQFVFADNVTLPDGVVRGNHPNEFEITSLKVFEGREWILPIRQVNVNQDVEADGRLTLETTAVVKAVSKDGVEGVLTIGGENELALKAATRELCSDRQVAMSASPIELDILDVTGQTTPIDVNFAGEEIDFNFSVGGEFENIDEVGFVEFNTNKPITITSSLNKDFGKINFEEGSCIALKFPENYSFDLTNSTLPYNKNLNAFVIDNLAELKNGKWTLALQRVDMNQKPQDGKFDVNTSIIIEPVNAKGEDGLIYVEGGDDFSLKEMAGSFGTYNIMFALAESPVEVSEMQVKTNNIDIDFETQIITQPIKLESLSYVNRIGSIELKEGSNNLLFRTGLKEGNLGRFNLAKNSVIDFIFPSEFRLDPNNSSIPSGARFVDSMHIQIYDLKALEEGFDWKLAVKRIVLDEPIENGLFEKDLTISVVASSADGEGDGKLTIAGMEDLALSEIKQVGGKREMEVFLQNCEVEIADVQASIDDIDFEFETQSFDFPVDIEDLELVKEIKYISFDREYNKIVLNISLDGTLEPFDLADNSIVKISFPKEFVFDLNACEFGNLDYRENENAIYINKIKDIKNVKLTLALERIEINRTIENNQFNWKGEISVTAINTATGEEDKLIIAGGDDLLLSDVQNVMCDKVVRFDVPAAKLRIEEAVIVSNMVKADINEFVEIPIDETLFEAIDRVDSIGFANPVPMILKITTTGLEDVDAFVNIDANITLPPVFNVISNDDKVVATKDGLSIKTSHNFKESSSLRLDLLVNSLDFTGLEGGCLTLEPTDNGNRKLQYNGKACIDGTVSMDGVELSSKLLDTGISMGVSFEMGEIVLKDFTGIYGGILDKVSDSFELGVENGFAELEKSGLTLSNTKPELMVSLYNTIGMPVDVDLSIVGRDKDGEPIATSTVVLEDLRIKPAQVDAQGTLVADTTRWIFTSDENTMVPGYEVVVVESLASLLNELPYSIDFVLDPQIVTKDVVHRVDLSKPLELGGHYSISVPFDLQFAQSVALDLGEEADFLRKEENKITLANPQLMVGIHNPIAQDLVFDLSIIGKDAEGQPLSSASLVFDEPFVLAAGQRNADGTITPTATRWLFAVSDTITKKGYETKEAPALATLLNELPHNIDIALNAHFNTDITTQIDYGNDLELTCEYGVLVPMQFSNIQLNYTDTVSELKFNLEEILLDMNLGLSDIGLAISMNLKNTLPLGLKLDLIPLDINGDIIEDIEIGSIELPAGDGSEIGANDAVEAIPMELSVKCASSSALSALDKISFRLDVMSGNGDNVLSGTQGLQISDIVLQIMCDVEMDLGK